MSVIKKPDYCWQEYDLEDVVRYFSKGFNPKPGTSILEIKHYIDLQKNVIVFRFLMQYHKRKKQ